MPLGNDCFLKTLAMTARLGQPKNMPDGIARSSDQTVGVHAPAAGQMQLSIRLRSRRFGLASRQKDRAATAIAITHRFLNPSPRLPDYKKTKIANMYATDRHGHQRKARL